MAQTVGIFSRSGEEDYAWLRDGLQKYCNVLPVYISNNNHSVMTQAIRQCQFAILYHTKNRGRINITDVTDSLYDDEIRQLSNSLGADKVIAVVDDLEDSSLEAKKKILNSQKTLRAKTQDIFLFTTTEKQNEEILREKLQLIINLIPRPTKPEQTDEPNINRVIQQDENIPKKTSQWVKLLVPALSAFVLLEAYVSPDVRNLILAGLWTAELIWTFCKMPLESLWSNRWIRFMLLWTIILVSTYNTYCRPSADNAGLSFFWLLASISLPYSHRFQEGYEQWAFKAMGYILVLYSFGKGWEMRNASNVPELIIQSVFCSPATMTVVWFPHQWSRHDRME